MFFSAIFPATADAKSCFHSYQINNCSFTLSPQANTWPVPVCHWDRKKTKNPPTISRRWCSISCSQSLNFPVCVIVSIFFPLWTFTLFKGKIVNRFNPQCKTGMCSGRGDAIWRGARTWSIYWRDELWQKMRSDFAVLLEDECHSHIWFPGGRGTEELTVQPQIQDVDQSHAAITMRDNVPVLPPNGF